MTDSATFETQMPDDGPPPIFDTARLLDRIQKLDTERMGRLSEIWEWNKWPRLEGLVDAETYRRYESAVNTVEPTAGAECDAGELQDLANQMYALPDVVREPCVEALKVYAGMDDPSRWLLTSPGRLEECRRIIGEAVAYAATLPAMDVPSVDELPPVDDTAEQVASAEYPGPKADAKTVLAWVGEDRNRAARAWLHEQERSTARKGVIAKLSDVLGPEGVEKVTEAIAAASPPPLDLSAGPHAASPAAPAETGAGGPGVAPPDASTDGPPAVAVEAAPLAPTLEVEDAVARALRHIGEGFIALAEAVA